MKIMKYSIWGLFLTIGLISCKGDFLDAEDTSSLSADKAALVAEKNSDVFLNGLWTWLVSFNTQNASGDDAAHDDFCFMSVLLSTDMMSEDIALGGFHWFGYDYDFDNRMYNYRRVNVDWRTFYTTISKANEILSSYPNGPSSDGQKALVGQALAIRGWAYYYLIQLFQNVIKEDGTLNMDAPGVPLIYTEADGKSLDEISAALGRNKVSDVLAQIESDLTKAVTYLTESQFERPDDENGKNNIDANVANGLLARYYLLVQEWQKAADAAKLARAGYPMMNQTELHDGFMDITNPEWMWGFNHTTETQTAYASFFSHISNLAPGYAGLGYSPKLIDARLYSKIGDDDYRKDLFNGADGDATQSMAGATKPYANLKFGNDGSWTMDYPYMRAAEMVLIEAEAYAHLNNGTKAATVLKELMSNRQPSWNKLSVTVEDVLLQRRIELWGEGFAYFDLKRNNKGIDRNYEGSNHLAGYLHTIPAQDVRWTYQIPRGEIQENDLISEQDQNP